MNIENLVVFGSFFAIYLNNNDVAICKTCDYKLLHCNNSKIWGMKRIPEHYLVLAGFQKWHLVHPQYPYELFETLLKLRKTKNSMSCGGKRTVNLLRT